jgi:hypothetical protein
MIGGFALAAAPVEHGVTGVKSFIRQPRRRCLGEEFRAGQPMSSQNMERNRMSLLHAVAEIEH